ncbi:unnamed protein product [Cyprideis torosa]|uniref:Uncharacterized protein n=1 Tax=Cyprideis torosa TaxID=163714 RepID=A0A7R8ZW45_9CRUS|nr:unnamed protein product [Cyprideis torosa]CAG0908530.1 unnamed protein product [Cyprideis torosa]
MSDSGLDYFLLVLLRPKRRLRRGPKCPETFVPLGNRCYHLGGRGEYKNWFEAQEYCSDLNSYLVELETQEEVTLVTSFMHATGECTEYWTGGEELGNSNTFVWHRTQQPVGPNNWHRGQPDDPTSGDAVFMYCGWDFQWGDYPKEFYFLYYLCETSPIIP